MFQVRKDGFKDNPAVPEELDLVEEEDQFTHMITLDDATTGIGNIYLHLHCSPSALFALPNLCPLCDPVFLTGLVAQSVM